MYEIALRDGAWQMVRPSRYARRFTMDTPFSVRGPAAGHAMLQTAADPAGRTVLGTLNNSAASQTPWGTYLSGEENWMVYFGGGDNLSAHHRRWGMRKDGFCGWDKFDTRFDATKNPNEPNRFGWVVEVDPMDPTSTPVKRTALGRAAALGHGGDTQARRWRDRHLTARRYAESAATMAARRAYQLSAGSRSAVCVWKWSRPGSTTQMAGVGLP